MTSSEVHVGGHVTLLFSIHDEDHLPRSQGSRGAGLCLDAGVTVRATATHRDRPPDLAGVQPGPRLDLTPAPVEVHVTDATGVAWPDGEALYHAVVDDLRKVRRLSPSTAVSMDVTLDLPVSQGFGMSGAGLLAAARAVLEANGTPDDAYAARVAHRLERTQRGGLGDVLAIHAGGMALRRQPGAPGVVGFAEGVPVDVPCLLVWQPDEARHTSAYIDHPDWKRSITSAGEAALAPLCDGPWTKDRWSGLLEAAKDFATNSGIAAEPERAALLGALRSSLEAAGMAGDWAVRLCMLGVSAVVVPSMADTSQQTSQAMQDALASTLSAHGYAAAPVVAGPSRDGDGGAVDPEAGVDPVEGQDAA